MTLEKPIIIEFVGMYGSGKTVTGQALVDSLKKQGFKVKTVHDFYEFRDDLPRFSRWFKYITNISTWRFFFPAFLNFILGKMKFKGGSYDFKRCFGPAKDIIDRIYFLKVACRDVDYVVFDEGSINDCINLTWRFGLGFDILKYQLQTITYLCEYKTRIMIFDTDVEISLSRINKRSGLTFIDYEKKEKRKEILLDVFLYFSFADKFLKDNYSNVKNLNLEDSLEHRITKIEKTIIKLVI